MNLRTRPAALPGPCLRLEASRISSPPFKRKPGRSSAPGRRRAASASAACSRGRARRGLHLFRKRGLRVLRPGTCGHVRPSHADTCRRALRQSAARTLPTKKAVMRSSVAPTQPAGKSRNKARTFPPLRTCGRAAQEKRRGYGKGSTIVTGEGRPQGRGRGFASVVMPRASLPRACHECCGRARAFSRSAARRSVSSVRDSTPRRIFRSTSR